LPWQKVRAPVEVKLWRTLCTGEECRTARANGRRKLAQLLKDHRKANAAAPGATQTGSPLRAMFWGQGEPVDRRGF